MNHTVRFIGGPQGGEIRAYPERPPMIIQTLAARDLMQIYAMEAPWSPYDIEEYEVRRMSQEGYWEAFWVNPNKSLRKQVEDQAGVIERLKFTNGNLLGEVKAMQPYKNLVEAVKMVLDVCQLGDEETMP